MLPVMGIIFFVIIVLALYFNSRNFPKQGGHYDEAKDLRQQVRELKEEIENLKKSNFQSLCNETTPTGGKMQGPAHPRLRMILAHWGGGLPFYELMPEIKRTMTQVYYDTAASPFLYSPKIYSIASEIVGSDRILFGSDYPLISPKRYFEELAEYMLSEDDRKRILGLNLKKLLELEEGETD